MEGYDKYVTASCEIRVTFALSQQGAVIDNCTYCPYRAKGGGYCHLFQRSMADDAKMRPFFCKLKLEEVIP